MKTRKTIPEISRAINTDQLDQTKLHLFKIFSLPIWLIIISIGLSFVTKPVRAGIEDIHPYYRYVPYEGPGGTAGTAGQQRPKQSSGASGTEAKKGEQATSPGGKQESAKPETKESAGTRSEETKKPEKPSEQTSKEPSATTGTTGQTPAPGNQPSTTGQTPAPGNQPATTGQAPAPGNQPSTTGQSAQQSKESKAESPTPCEHEQKTGAERKVSPVGKPGKDTGEFPSGDIPSFCQVDVNRDHYVTKDELENFPDLLKIFDKIDAGKDGRLEQHEFQNLEMEAKREGEIM